MVFLLNNVMKKNTFTKLTEDDFVTVYCKDGEILDGVVNVVPHAVDIGINQYGDLDMQFILSDLKISVWQQTRTKAKPFGYTIIPIDFVDRVEVDKNYYRPKNPEQAKEFLNDPIRIRGNFILPPLCSMEEVKIHEKEARKCDRNRKRLQQKNHL